MMKGLIVAVLLTLGSIPAWAVEPSEMLDNPVLEQRAREISKGLRCLVCQNQSIDESNAGLARDLRLLVRKRLVAGDSDKEVVNFIVARYGDFVLLRPPFKLSTLALWLGPLVILFGAGLFHFYFFRRRSNQTATAYIISREDRERLDSVLENTDIQEKLS